MSLRVWAAGVLSLAANMAWAAVAGSLDASNVLVLYNAGSADGRAIADHYAEVHPGVRLLPIDGVSTCETIGADEYLQVLRPQIVGALTPQTEVIVTTKGLPLRIDVAPHTNPGTYVDPFGVQRTVYNSTWRRYSSLESELTLVDTVSTWQQMGDQTWWMPPNPDGSTGPHFTVNPYYKQSLGFHHVQFGTRLTARLDAFTVEDVFGEIDRAQRARTGSPAEPQGRYNFVLDDQPILNVDQMETTKAKILGPRLEPTLYDGTAAFWNTSAAKVLGYVGYGRNQPSTPEGYLVNEQGLQFSLADGAVFQSFESYNAFSFKTGGNRAGQGLVAEWIARGGTAGTGTVEEPHGGPSYLTNEDVMFDMLLRGYTWAEAVWAATLQLSYVNTLVGDPLMRWLPLDLGDSNGDGQIDGTDFAALDNGFNGRLSGWANGDFNIDGLVDGSDYAIIDNAFNSQRGFAGGAVVPEPAGLTLALAAAVALAVWAVAGRPRIVAQ